ncbi:NUDIX domain-containing protein [Streptomyces phaeochromogenes]|uniref:NUDIX domain-containing protein n=1 Tax=Streptomyces phaeochromogenes TaxID=1923 RepID=UPI0036C00DAA
MTHDEDRDLFCFPGGMREPGESDNETLLREIEEELQAVVVAGTLVHFGTFETRSDHGRGKLP